MTFGKNSPTSPSGTNTPNNLNESDIQFNNSMNSNSINSLSYLSFKFRKNSESIKPPSHTSCSPNPNKFQKIFNPPNPIYIEDNHILEIQKPLLEKEENIKISAAKPAQDSHNFLDFKMIMLSLIMIIILIVLIFYFYRK